MTIKKGKSTTIKALVKKIQKDKRLMTEKHSPLLRFLSSDKSIATASKAGTISGKKKGTCYVFVYAHNGVAKKVKITVK